MDRDLLKALHKQAMAGDRQAVSPIGRIAHQIACVQQSIQAKDPTIAAWHLYTGHSHSGLRFQLTGISQQAIEYRDHIGALFPISQFAHVGGLDLSNTEAASLFAADRHMSALDRWEKGSGTP